MRGGSNLARSALRCFLQLAACMAVAGLPGPARSQGLESSSASGAASAVPSATGALSDNREQQPALDEELSPSLTERLLLSGATKDYRHHRLAPGDTLQIELFDGKERQEVLAQVSSAGEATLPLLRNVVLSGMLPEEAAAYLTDLYRRYYHNPLVNLRVASLGEIEVLAFGPDFAGSTLRVPTGTGLAELLSQLHLFNGHYRRIQLIRGGGAFSSHAGLGQIAPERKAFMRETPAVDIVAPRPIGQSESQVSEQLVAKLNSRVDLQRWLAAPGAQSWEVDPTRLTVDAEFERYNFELQDFDVLFIPAPLRAVKIEGVARPGWYELLEGETLADLLELAGPPSLTRDARTASILRIGPDGMHQKLVIDLVALSSSAGLGQRVELFNRDVVSVSVANRIFQVLVGGPDLVGQHYSARSGERLYDFLTGEDFPLSAAIKTGAYRRIHLIRSGSGPILNHLQAAPPLDHSQTVTSGGALPQEAAQSATLSAQLRSGSALARHKVPGSSIASKSNWREWIAARQLDPDTRIWLLDPLQIAVENNPDAYAAQNVELLEGDVIYLPAPERYVEVSGVRRQAEFQLRGEAGVPAPALLAPDKLPALRIELLGEETLAEVLRLTGSVNQDFDLRNAVVERFDQSGRLCQVVVEVARDSASLAQVGSFRLQHRDRISFGSFERRVFVLGEVRGGGVFDYSAGATVLDYLALAGGETAEANLPWIAIIRQNRDRANPLSSAEVLQINFKEIHKGLPNAQDYFPQPGDVIYVPPKGASTKVNEIVSALGTVITGYAVVQRSTDGN